MRNRDYRGAIKAAIALLLVCAGIAYAGVLIVTRLQANARYSREIWSHWNLADKSSTIQAKAQHVDRFVAALESAGLAGEYDAILFPTPDNSFDLNLEALRTLQGRLHEIEKMNVGSFEYQTAMQQITAQEQGEASQMLGVFEGAWYKRNMIILWDWILVLNMIGISVLIIAGGILWFHE